MEGAREKLEEARVPENYEEWRHHSTFPPLQDQVLSQATGGMRFLP